MIVVTGAAGFIGSNLLLGLNARGADALIAVDELTDGTKFRNLADAEIADYMDRDVFVERFERNELGKIDAVFHQGACSTTTEWNGRFVMDVNYRYSQRLLQVCTARGIPFLYASSAAVYGPGPGFSEVREDEHPINVYAYSKFLFDQYVRRQSPKSQVVGLRYFNVYGPREAHKGGMASVAFHFDRQLREENELRLFVGSDGYGDGEQRRDFIHVDDTVALNLWFWEHPQHSGIFNAGTGRARSFNDVANAVIAWHGRGKIRYIPFPPQLVGRYQSYTQADPARLRAAGYDADFLDVAEGVRRYLDWLHGTGGHA